MSPRDESWCSNLESIAGIDRLRNAVRKALLRIPGRRGCTSRPQKPEPLERKGLERRGRRKELGSGRHGGVGGIGKSCGHVDVIASYRGRGLGRKNIRISVRALRIEFVVDFFTNKF